MKINHKAYLLSPIVFVLLYISSMFLLPKNLDFTVTKSQFQIFLWIVGLIILGLSLILAYKKQYKNIIFLLSGVLLSVILYFISFILILGIGMGA